MANVQKDNRLWCEFETTVGEQLGYACRCSNCNSDTSLVEILLLVVKLEVLGEKLMSDSGQWFAHLCHFSSWTLDTTNSTNNIRTANTTETENQRTRCPSFRLLGCVFQHYH